MVLVYPARTGIFARGGTAGAKARRWTRQVEKVADQPQPQPGGGDLGRDQSPTPEAGGATQVLAQPGRDRRGRCAAGGRVTSRPHRLTLPPPRPNTRIVAI